MLGTSELQGRFDKSNDKVVAIASALQRQAQVRQITHIGSCTSTFVVRRTTSSAAVCFLDPEPCGQSHFSMSHNL